MEALLNKRLWLFWTPWIFILPEWDPSLQRTVDINKYYNYNTYMKANDQQWYWLFFTPNWNLGKVNSVWETINRKKDSCEQYISCLYVDIDLKNSQCDNMEKLLKVTLDTILIDKLPVQYIVQSWWWYHLYMFVKPNERNMAWQTFINKYKDIQETLSKVFDWWDKSSHSLNKLMRLPRTKYRRNIPIRVTKLLKVNYINNKIEVEEIETEEQIYIDEDLSLSVENINAFIENTSEIKQVKTKWAEYIWDMWSFQINAIPIVDIIEKLHSYPREYEWITYEFWLKWNRIVLKQDWQTYIPDWYKVNREENYVHNFSMWAHPIEERPRWPSFSFMYHYFKRDITLLNKFLTDEYNISLTKWWTEWENYICLPTESWYIYFTEKWVFYAKSVFNKKAKTYEDIQIKLFDVAVYIKWVIRTDYDLYWESDEENFFYMLYNTKTKSEMIIEYTVDRKWFNKKYWKKWLIFLGSEFDLIDFYNAINKAADSWVVREYDLRYLNGWYQDYFVMWDTVYDRYAAPINYKEIDIILKTQTISRTRGNKDVTIAEFGDKLKKVFSLRTSMIWLATFITLMLWHKFRVPILKWYKQQVLMPWLFLSWTTKSGKALSGSTEIPMSDGTFKQIKDIVEWDSIVWWNWLSTNVIGKYNPQQSEVYRVSFTDWSYVDTCADHLWKVYSFKKNYKEYVLSTKQILEDWLIYNWHNNYSININKTQYTKQQYTITPYTLWVWLWDGSSDSSKIWIKHWDESIIDNIPEDTHIVAVERGCSKYRIKWLNSKLRELNLLQNKHIPQQYLSWSIEQRMELLAGLLDTDGTVNKKSNTTVTISTSVPALAEWIKQLINSLWRTYNLYKRIPKYTYKWIKKEWKMEYRISFYPDTAVFKLQRQNNKLNINRRPNRRFIKSIVPILKEEEYYCIAVDNEDHTFMCTKSYIKTHNTTLLTILKNWAEINYDTRKYSVVGTSPQPLKQAATDDFVLHLEEFTWLIWDVKETILRDVLNKARTARWMSDWWNTYYVFRSSLILDWEHMPKSESVANRCIVVPMFDTKKEKIWTEKTLSDMIWLSFLKEFISKSYQYKQQEVLDLFKQSEATLRKVWVTDRNLLIYSFLLTTNNMFQIFNETELIECILSNLALHNTIDKENNVLWNILSELIIKNRISPTIVEEEDYWRITIPYTMDLRAQNKVMFIDIVQQFPDNIKIIWSNINIKIFAKNGQILANKQNIDVYNIVIPYKSYFKQERFLDFVEWITDGWKEMKQDNWIREQDREAPF